jgi:hypothetical protein
VVALGVVAASVGEHEVGEGVIRHPAPRDEVIDLDLGGMEAVTAVEAAAPLQVLETRYQPGQCGPAGPEEEVAETVLGQHSVVQPRDGTRPVQLDQRADEPRQRDERVSDAWLQDDLHRAGLQVPHSHSLMERTVLVKESGIVGIGRAGLGVALRLLELAERHPYEVQLDGVERLLEQLR